MPKPFDKPPLVEYDYDATPPPTLTRGQKLVFWQAFISRVTEYPILRDGLRDDLIQMGLGALYSVLEQHPAERDMLTDIWDVREDKELLYEAVGNLNKAANKLLVYELPPEQPPWKAQAGFQSERGSNFRELVPG